MKKFCLTILLLCACSSAWAQTQTQNDKIKAAYAVLLKAQKDKASAQEEKIRAEKDLETAIFRLKNASDKGVLYIAGTSEYQGAQRRIEALQRDLKQAQRDLQAALKKIDQVEISIHHALANVIRQARQGLD